MNGKLKILLPAAAVIMAAGLSAPPSAIAQVKLRWAHVGTANAPQTIYADEVAKLVKERTDGRVQIQVFPNSQLGNAGEMVDGVKSGAISMGHHDFASLAKIVPNVAVFNTPFVYRDAEHSLRATREGLPPRWRCRSWPPRLPRVWWWGRRIRSATSIRSSSTKCRSS
jgi:TRAP-type C4-dicarboxylate transport system substrate-binding protein